MPSRYLFFFLQRAMGGFFISQIFYEYNVFYFFKNKVIEHNGVDLKKSKFKGDY